MIQELPEVKSDELSTINAELKKLGISGGRGELTQAGRDRDIYLSFSCPFQDN